MGVEKLDIKNRVFTLPAKLVNIFDVNPEKLDIQKERNDDISIYYIRYDLDPFYLVIDDLCGYFEEKGGNKYLTLISNRDQDVIHDKYVKVWEEIKKAINKVANNKLSDYNKDYGIIKFDSDDSLPLNSVVKIHSLTVVIRYVLEKDRGFYPQIFLDHCLYEI